ncbi:MAG: hypothetical protein ACLQM6_08655 [Acidobacteriaceae bacterium]
MNDMTESERVKRALASLSALEKNLRAGHGGYVHEPEIYKTYNQILGHLNAAGFDTGEYLLPPDPVGNMDTMELLIKIDSLLAYFSLPPSEERKIGFSGPRKSS